MRLAILTFAIGTTLVAAYFYFRPPKLRPLTQDALDRINRLQGYRGDIED